MKEKIREFIKGLDVDDVGFAAAAAYQSPRSPRLESLFPGARSIIVTAYRELSTCESPFPQLAVNGRLDKNAVMRQNNYKIARFLENSCGAKLVTIPSSYTSDLQHNTEKGVSDFSLRHAAVAAGLGRFGRNNLVIHPRFGARVTFNAVITNLELESDPPVTEDPCIHCNICVDNCPARALDTAGRTDIRKCLQVAQPFGTNPFLMYLDQFVHAAPEEKAGMLNSYSFLPFYQAVSDGTREYNCFNCLKLCPVGQHHESAL